MHIYIYIDKIIKCRIQVYLFDREISMWHNSWFRRRSLPVARCFHRKLPYRHIEHCHSCLWTSNLVQKSYHCRITTPPFSPSSSIVIGLVCMIKHNTRCSHFYTYLHLPCSNLSSYPLKIIVLDDIVPII